MAFDPLQMMEAYSGLPVPDPVTFCLGEQWLSKARLYPRQVTFLKILFLRDDLFTDYDHKVIAEWIQMFKDTNPPDPTGKRAETEFSAQTKGIQPDIYDRINWCKERGYKWFKELILAIGRRGSKGFMCSLGMSYVLWYYLARGNPQEFYGIDQSKAMEIMIFAGKKDQAKRNLWADLHAVITESECFTGSMGRNFISKNLVEVLSVYAPYDEIRIARQAAKGVVAEKDMATFQIVPRESNPLAARGGAGFIVGFDEAAHVKTTGVTREFREVYNAAKPALDQFGTDSFICLPSSTWEMTGMFYELWVQSLQDDPVKPGDPMFPNKLMMQLSSWHPYEDWEIAHEIELFPRDFKGDLGEYEDAPHPKLRRLRGPIQAYDEEMKKEERANPDTFAVERRSDWATSLDAYLNSARVDDIFRPWEGRLEHYGPPFLTQQERGPLSISYFAHGDPASVNHRFGFCLGHAEPDEQGLLHAVIDVVKYWDPAMFPPDNIIDYDVANDWIFDYAIMKFQPTLLSFDQYNVMATVPVLMKRTREARLQKQVMIAKAEATSALNWARWETMKAAINLHMAHCFTGTTDSDELKKELRFLTKPEGMNKVEPPESGPCTTNDIADAFCHVIFDLLGEQMSMLLPDQLGAMRPGMAMGYQQVDPFKRFDPNEAMFNPMASAMSMVGHGALARGTRPRTGGMPNTFTPPTRGSMARRGRHRS